MSKYEILSILVSILAVVVALVSLARTRKLNEKQVELQKITAELSKKQLELIQESEIALSVAQVDVELEGYGSDYQFIISNVGGAEAKNVDFVLNGDDSTLIKSEFKRKIPIHALRPGKSVELSASIFKGSPRSFNINVSWENPNGDIGNDKFLLSI